VIAETIPGAWSAGAGPGKNAVTIDVDSTICQVHSKHKHGAAFVYTKVLGYHLLATLRRRAQPPRSTQPLPPHRPRPIDLPLPGRTVGLWWSGRSGGGVVGRS
jgi:hypothetical protein